jgi:hypothetical protein
MNRSTKITFAEMRDMGVRGVLVYCSDYKCSHSQAIRAEQWSNDVRLSDIEDRFVCKACGKRGAAVSLGVLQDRSEVTLKSSWRRSWFIAQSRIRLSTLR